MTSKAKYIGRCVDKYDRDSVELEYEYKGETYWYIFIIQKAMSHLRGNIETNKLELIKN